MDHSRKEFCKFNHLFYIHRTSDIRSTAADKGSDPRLFFRGNLSFRRIFFLPNERSARFSNDGKSLCRRTARLNHTFGKILGLCESAASKNSWTACLNGLEVSCGTELMGIEFDA